MTVYGFSHININCTDLDATVGFYADLLGMPVAKEFPVRENTGALVGLAPPHTNRVTVLSSGSGEPGMELIEWHLPTPPPALEVPAGKRLAGLAALRFTVSDLQAVRAALPEAKEQNGLVVARAPEGERVELVQGDRTALQAATVVVADLDAAAHSYDAVLGIKPGPDAERSGDDGAPFRELDLIVPAKPTPLTVTLREYGLAIITHTTHAVGVEEQLEAFAKAKVDPARCLIGHQDEQKDYDVLLKIVERGHFVGFDRIGISRLAADEHRADNIARLVRDGYAGQICLSQDRMCYDAHPRPAYWIPPNRAEEVFRDIKPVADAELWGRSHTYMFTSFFPMLLERGVSQEELDLMMTQNAVRLLTGR